MKNPREKLVELMRGFYALPLIAYLGMEGVLDDWLAQNWVRSEDFTMKKDKKTAVLSYLNSIGLIDFKNGKEYFSVSDIGRKIFSRHGAYNIIHSYHDYFSDIGALLDEGNHFKVDRFENVYGSGHVHLKKFFQDSLELISENIETHIDIACGDGTFLEFLSEKRKTIQKSYGVDLSEDSIDSTVKRFSGNKRGEIFSFLANDGLKVKEWKNSLEINSDSYGLISLWFFIHEISKREPCRVVNFFKDLCLSFPKSDVLICENVLLDSKELRSVSDISVAPEFLLFHQLSDQGVLTWSQYQEILSEIPYEIKSHKEYDIVGENKSPSSFIWLLTPKGNESEKD